MHGQHSMTVLMQVGEVVKKFDLDCFESKWMSRFVEKWRPFSDDEIRNLALMWGVDDCD